MKPMQQVIEVEPETDDQSPSEEEQETPPDEPFVAVEIPEQEHSAAASLRSLRRGTKSRKCAPFWLKRLRVWRRTACCNKWEENVSLKPSSKLQKNMHRPWKSTFGGSRAGRVWSLRLVTRSVLQKLVDDPAIDTNFQHDEEEVYHTPTNDRRETAEAGATQLAGIRVAARHDREDEGPRAEGEVRKCLNAASSFPWDVYS